MKKITNRLLCALILLCAFGVFVGCQQEPETKPGTSINSPSIVGTWEFVGDMASGPDKFVFEDSGSFVCYMLGDYFGSGSYSVSGTSATLIIDGYDESGKPSRMVWSATFGKTSLTIKYGQGEGIYHRV